MKSQQKRLDELSEKMFQVYGEYLEECATDKVEIADVFNLALRALARQTSSIILQFSACIIPGDARKQEKEALKTIDHFHKMVRRELPNMVRDAYASVVVPKGPWG